jgi:hypothetical protein
MPPKTLTTELQLLSRIADSMESIDLRLSWAYPHPYEVDETIERFIDSAIGCGVDPFA